MEFLEIAEYQEIITFIMEMLGTVAFAASGAMVGVGRKMDIFGVSVLGVVTAVGGGMIRDIILGNIPPSVFQHAVYAAVATVTSCLVFLVLYWNRELLEGRFRVTYDRIMLVMDSIGLGIFTVVGVNTGIQHGYIRHTFLLVFLGTITGVGGGLLRDMMAGVPPYIFVRHVYACASIVGAIACVYMYRYFGAVEAMVVSSGVVILIRYLAAHYHWNLPRLQREEEEK
ncbi:MAG: trimeric intracellular cation channel family protein [Eubacteriales bacterium]|nr:trimeric intracellular cation channel family protein [Eubacteriales bacterium]